MEKVIETLEQDIKEVGALFCMADKMDFDDSVRLSLGLALEELRSASKNMQDYLEI